LDQEVESWRHKQGQKSEVVSIRTRIRAGETMKEWEDVSMARMQEPGIRAQDAKEVLPVGEQ